MGFFDFWNWGGGLETNCPGRTKEEATSAMQVAKETEQRLINTAQYVDAKRKTLVAQAQIDVLEGTLKLAEEEAKGVRDGFSKKFSQHKSQAYKRGLGTTAKMVSLLTAKKEQLNEGQR